MIVYHMTVDCLEILGLLWFPNFTYQDQMCMTTVMHILFLLCVSKTIAASVLDKTQMVFSLKNYRNFNAAQFGFDGNKYTNQYTNVHQ